MRGYVSYLASVVEDAAHDICLHIGDNSCNPEKHEFLTRLRSPRVKVHLHADNLGVHRNVAHLFAHSSGQLVQLLGDDDWIHPDSFTNVTFLEKNPACSSCTGLFARVPPGRDNALACFDDRFMGSDPLSRSIDYVRYVFEETEINWLALAVHRRQIVSTYIEYSNVHPFPFYFRDQLLSQIALLNGPVKGLREGFIFYKVRSEEEQAAHVASFKKGLKEMGLKAWLYEYYYYLLACEYVALYLYRGLPDSMFSDRIDAANQIFAALLTGFENDYRQKSLAFERHFDRTGIRNTVYAVFRTRSAIEGLRGMVDIFTKINPEAGTRYTEFLRREMAVAVLA